MTTNDYDKAYYGFHMRLLQAFVAQVKEQPPFYFEDCAQEDKDFFLELSELSHSGGADQLMQGQHLLCRIVAVYPHLMPLVPRDLLWFFGGDCLHYMPDEEIRVFQELDELRQQANEVGSPFSYEKARLKSMGLQ